MYLPALLLLWGNLMRHVPCSVQGSSSASAIPYAVGVPDQVTYVGNNTMIRAVKVQGSCCFFFPPFFVGR